jgi:hypothetical protein
VKIRFSGTDETPAQAFDRLFSEKKKRVADIVQVHRRAAPGYPVGRLEKAESPALFSVALLKEGRRTDAQGRSQGADGAREYGFFMKQMIECGFADARTLQEGIE